MLNQVAIVSQTKKVKMNELVLVSAAIQKQVTFDWAPIRYRNVISVLKNPFYVGAYAYG